MPRTLDEIDMQILQLLQERGRIKRGEIAEQVGLSVASVSERMRKLEAAGYIQGYRGILNAKKLNLDITAFIRVSVEPSRYYADFVERAMALPEVQEVHSITGEGSHILKVRTQNTTTLEQLLSQIQSWPGVHGTSTSIVLSTFKETSEIPLSSTNHQAS